MHKNTHTAISELENMHWFNHVGKNDCTNALILNSWDEAIKLSKTIAWSNFRLDAANKYRARLLKLSKDYFKLWNPSVDEIKKISRPLVQRKISSVIHKNNLSKGFENTVHWDILHYLMEAEFAHITPPAFYTDLASWYLGGHFPCGWEGDFPKGKLIIY